MRKMFIGIGILVLLSTIVFSAAFDLSGRWVASFERHEKDDGFLTAYDGRVAFVFEQQEGNVFTGYKEFIDHSVNYQEKKEPFSGVIDYSGEKLYCAEHEDGYLFGDIVSENEIVMYYVDAEENALAVYYTLQRENTIPNLLGEWQSETIGSYVKEKNHLGKGQTGLFVITEQHGHVFTGYKNVKTLYTDEHKEEFSGVISKDGKKLYIAEHNDGYAFADIIDANTIHLYYLEDGNLKTLYQVLRKVK
jgi:hypothetical protein